LSGREKGACSVGGVHSSSDPDRDARSWLGEEAATQDELLPLLKPYPDEVLKIWPVGKAVGNVKNTGPQLAAPAPG
jgi:putative SOS response-associated peptidase YedK